MKKKIILLKNKYEKDIDFYKTIFKLYVENRTEFFIRGRQRIMESVGRKYNESNIVTIQDKYNWLIVHEDPEMKSKIVGKILLHNYSKKILGKDICVPILKIYNKISDINIEELPDKFVLKCNHGSGMNILCKDKKKFNLINAKKSLEIWMNINYGLQNFEFQYINVKKNFC